MAYSLLVGKGTTDGLAGIVREIKAEHPGVDVSIARLANYSLHETIEQYRRDPATFLKDYLTYQHEKKAGNNGQ